MMEEKNSIETQIRNHIDVLADLSEQLDPTDLGELAQIHENALKINETVEGQTEPIFVSLREFCQKVSQIAEDTILECQANPHETLQRLNQAVHRLQDMIHISENIPDAGELIECMSILEGGNATTAPAAAEPTVENTETSSDTEPSPRSEIEAPAADASEPKTDHNLTEYQQEPLILAAQEFEYVQSFLTECQEHIENIETGVLELEQNTEDLDKINELFRPFHTIKGMAGFLNLRDVQALTHEVETLLDLGRKGKLKITPPHHRPDFRNAGCLESPSVLDRPTYCESKRSAYSSAAD